MQTDPLKILEAYARFPSVSTDPAYAEGMEGARAFVCEQLAALGFSVESVKTPLHPIILAERKGAANAPHVVVYGHYDVQPADPFELWETPPFEPTVRNARVYARGAADNKGPVSVQLAALARILGSEPDFPLNITYLIEGEEEMGSPSFPAFLETYASRLREADLVVLSDTGIPSTDRMVITTGLRGLCALELEVLGPRSDLHSGVHGGAVRNPATALAELLASLHDTDGRVNIPGFYDAVIEPEVWEREELKRMPLDEAAYQQFLGVPHFWTAKGYSPFEAVRFAPTLECNGLGGGYQGAGSKTIIPSRAFAKLTCRLVPNQQPEEIMRLLRETLQARCPAGVRLKITDGDGGPPYHVVPPGKPNTPADQPEAVRRAFESAEDAIASVFTHQPIYLREGGSVPIIAQIKEATGLDSLMLGIFAPEDNLHAPNESFELAFMEKATQVYERFFRTMAHA